MKPVGGESTWLNAEKLKSMPKTLGPRKRNSFSGGGENIYDTPALLICLIFSCLFDNQVRRVAVKDKVQGVNEDDIGFNEYSDEDEDSDDEEMELDYEVS